MSAGVSVLDGAVCLECYIGVYGVLEETSWLGLFMLYLRGEQGCESVSVEF